VSRARDVSRRSAISRPGSGSAGAVQPGGQRLAGDVKGIPTAVRRRAKKISPDVALAIGRLSVAEIFNPLFILAG